MDQIHSTSTRPQRALIVKLSSLGDLIHTLPALTEAKQHNPHITFDWLCEPGFAEIPSLHPAVETVYTLPLRKWAKRPWHMLLTRPWRDLKKQLRAQHYDYIIDAQGLLKSSLAAKLAKGPRHGPRRHVAREPLASMFYHHQHTWEKYDHAVARIKTLFGSVLGYTPNDDIDYGLHDLKFENTSRIPPTPYMFFLHGTTWDTKHWPEQYWCELADIATAQGVHVVLPWGNTLERERALRIQRGHDGITVLEKRLPFIEIAQLLHEASAIVAVDTGLGHLAAALHAPTVSLYGPTDPKRTGSVGPNQHHIQAHFRCAPCLKRTCQIKDHASQTIDPPCFGTVPPYAVWETLTQLDAADKPRHVGETAQHVGKTAQHDGETAQHDGETAQHVGETAQHVGETAQHDGETPKHG